MSLFDTISDIFVKKSIPVTETPQVDWIAKAFNDTAKDLLSAKEEIDPYKVETQNIDFAKCYDLVRSSDILKSSHKVVKRETFKAGIEVFPLFLSKCSECGKEFDSVVDACPECEEAGLPHEIITPNDNEYTRALEKVNNCNINNRTLQEELEQIEDDLNTVDEGYVYFHKDNFYRLSPLNMSPVINKSKMLGYVENNNILLFSRKNRKSTKTISEDIDVPAGYEQADYKSVDNSYYNRREIVRVNKWDTGMDRSYPIVMTIWFKVISLIQMDSYTYKWYIGERSPKTLITFNAAPSEVEGLKKQFAQQDKANMSTPNKPMVMAVPVRDGKTLMEVHDFSKSPAELQSREAQDTFRRVVASIYGVTPLYISDVQTSGGLNNETQQVNITRDSLIENIQRHNKILERYSKYLGLKDWVIKVKVPDEIEFTRKYEKEKMQLEVAQMKYNLGYEVNYNDDSEDWEIGDKREPTNNYSDKLFNFADEKKKMN